MSLTDALPQLKPTNRRLERRRERHVNKQSLKSQISSFANASQEQHDTHFGADLDYSLESLMDYNEKLAAGLDDVLDGIDPETHGLINSLARFDKLVQFYTGKLGRLDYEQQQLFNGTFNRLYDREALNRPATVADFVSHSVQVAIAKQIIGE